MSSALSPGPRRAVLTGDLIGSTGRRGAATDAALALLARTGDAIARWSGASSCRFTRYRGDGWQMILPDPALALRAALVLAARLRAAELAPDTRPGSGSDPTAGPGSATGTDSAAISLPDTRIAIGIGTVLLPETGDLAAAGGPGFVASGHALDELSRSRRFAIAGAGVTELHRAVLVLAEEQSGRWTAEQAEATAHYLAPEDPTLATIAGILGITPQAVSYRLKGAGAQNLRSAVRLWETHARHSAALAT